MTTEPASPMDSEAVEPPARTEIDDALERTERLMQVVTSQARESAVAASCAARDGSEAALVVGDQGEERLQVRDGRGVLLFEYVPDVSRCLVYAPTGDLVLRTPHGRIDLEAAEGVRIRSGSEIEVEAETLRTKAGAAEVTVGEARISGKTLTSTFHRVRQTVDVLETTAGRVVERARETYREVEGLAQIRADRIRLVAERTFHVMGTHTLLKARKDLKLKGDKIHLG